MKTKVFSILTIVMILGIIGIFSLDPVDAQFISRLKNYSLEDMTIFGSTTVEDLDFTATDTEPGTTEGMVYWDDSENGLKQYDGSSWVALGGGTFAGGAVTDNMTMTSTKVMRSTTTTDHTTGISVYDNDTGPGYVNAFGVTNGNTPAIVMGSASVTAAITSSDWAIGTTGIMTGIGAVTTDGLATLALGADVSGAAVNLNASSNFAVNVGTGTSTGTVTVGGTGIQSISIGNGAAAKTVALGSENTSSTTTIKSGSGGVVINAGAVDDPVNIATGASTGTVTIGGSGAQTVAINDGEGAKTTSLGSVNTTSTTTINSGSGDITATATGGDIILVPNASVSMSDKNVTNVGIIDVDTIRDDATATIGYFLKTRKVTIGHVGDATADFQWTTAADHTAQNIDLGAVVPAFARVLDVTVICTETMVGQTNMLLVLGNQSAGTEFIASTDCDTINNSIAGAAAGTPFVAINNSASNVWVNGDPDDNTWADMSAGMWTVLVTYVDNSAASSAL